MAETTPDELHGWQARRAAQEKEYGTYVAGEDVYTSHGVLAYAKGHPVPASNVDGDGRVVVGRHMCGDPNRTGHELCDRHNEPEHWTEPGVAVKPAAGKPAATAKSTPAKSAAKEG